MKSKRDKSKRAVNHCILNGSNSYIQSRGVNIQLGFDDAFALNNLLNSEKAMKAALCCCEKEQIEKLMAIGAAIDSHVGGA